jgi:orotate phosphoribosyltransferase
MLLKLLAVFFDPVIWGGAIVIAIVVTIIESRRFIIKEITMYVNLGWLSPALTFSKHGFTHQGGSSGYYFNLDYLTTSPVEARKLTKWYVDEINKSKANKRIDSIAFIEKDSGPVGAIAIMGNIITETDIPAVIVRLRKRVPFAKITGNPETLKKIQNGAKVVVITDMFTTKRTVKDTVDVIQESGAVVVGVYGILDRQGEILDIGQNIPIVAYATQDDLTEGRLLNTERM